MEMRARKPDGTELIAQTEWVRGVLWVHFAGRTFAVDPKASSQRRKKAGGSGRGDIINAPMPGKITKVFKQPGETVHRGDALIAMEAMKMEYTLRAEADGEISELQCQSGQQVGLGQQLVTLKLQAVPS